MVRLHSLWIQVLGFSSLVWLVSSPCHALPVTLLVEGTVEYFYDTAGDAGFSLAPGTPFTTTVTYDSSWPGQEWIAGVASYEYRQHGGPETPYGHHFQAGDVSVLSDSSLPYLRIVIRNDKEVGTIGDSTGTRPLFVDEFTAVSINAPVLRPGFLRTTFNFSLTDYSLAVFSDTTLPGTLPGLEDFDDGSFTPSFFFMGCRDPEGGPICDPYEGFVAGGLIHSVRVIPEPATGLLMGFGAAILLLGTRGQHS